MGIERARILICRTCDGWESLGLDPKTDTRPAEDLLGVDAEFGKVEWVSCLDLCPRHAVAAAVARTEETAAETLHVERVDTGPGAREAGLGRLRQFLEGLRRSRST